jgi:hypothetical protein
MARWLWDHHFAAVASDNMAVEAMPPMIDGILLTGMTSLTECLQIPQFTKRNAQQTKAPLVQHKFFKCSWASNLQIYELK